MTLQGVWLFATSVSPLHPTSVYILRRESLSLICQFSKNRHGLFGGVLNETGLWSISWGKTGGFY